MERHSNAVDRFMARSPKNRRLLHQEQLILEATEMLSAALERGDISRTELADRLGKSKGFVSQILAGGRNLTLRTLSDVADSLNCRVRMSLEPIRHVTRAEAATRRPLRRKPRAGSELSRRFA